MSKDKRRQSQAISTSANDVTNSVGKGKQTFREFRSLEIELEALRSQNLLLMTQLKSANEELEKFRQETRGLRYHAETDPLTKLANRRLFFQKLEDALALANRFKDNVAVIYLDLDGFKQVNDFYGHGQGDNVLIQVANLLKECVREVDTIARLGGDEFAIILARTSKLNITETAQRIVDTLILEVNENGFDVNITASVGIAMFPDDSMSPLTLLKYADAAMYRAKEQGKRQYCWHISSSITNK
jgi:diguanylate cyclase (GGDEF)-like protein